MPIMIIRPEWHRPWLR